MEKQEDKFFIIDRNMKNLNSSRKGQTVQSLPMLIMTLVFAAVVLVMGLIVTQSLQDTTDGDQTGTISTNETLTIINDTGTTEAIDNFVACGYASFTPLTVFNSSNDEALTLTTHYTVNSATGTLSNVSDVDGDDWYITYTYTWGGIACESANSTVVGLGTFADFWEIIVLAIVITVVIGLLLVVFGGRRER